MGEVLVYSTQLHLVTTSAKVGSNPTTLEITTAKGGNIMFFWSICAVIGFMALPVTICVIFYMNETGTRLAFVARRSVLYRHHIHNDRTVIVQAALLDQAGACYHICYRYRIAKYQFWTEPGDRNVVQIIDRRPKSPAQEAEKEWEIPPPSVVRQ